MIDSLILLTQPDEVRPFSAILAAYNPALRIYPATTLAELGPALTAAGSDARLITLLSGVIVPAELLATLRLPGYNFHPGPPDYPGKYPAPFALYDGADQFGATVHELAPRVDSGPIVGCEMTPIPTEANIQWYIKQSYCLVMKLFLRFAPHLARSSTPLPRQPMVWGKRICSQRAVEEISELPPDISADELERRIKAFGHLRHIPLTHARHGYRFVLA